MSGAAAAPRREGALTVAVTGATGQIGRPFIASLEESPAVSRVVGLARSPFDPAEEGWGKVEYRRGDILDRDAVDSLVADADVVVHLAFIIVADHGKSREINLEGSLNVFRAAAAAGARRLVYTSSVAAYGFDDDMPALLSEELPARGAERHPYSAQKAEVEAELAAALQGSATEAYVFRPCIVGGPRAQLLVESIPFIDIGQSLPGAVSGLLGRVPALKPVLPDPGVPIQLVHHDDVAAALRAAVLGEGEPGVYNLAAVGQVTIADLAHELGWHSIHMPRLAVDATARVVAWLPFLPAEASWVEAARRPVLMDTARARMRLGWEPRHSAPEILRETVAAWRKRWES